MPEILSQHRKKNIEKFSYVKKHPGRALPGLRDDQI